MYISIHAPNEGCDANLIQYHTEQAISIHAPNEGCDVKLTTKKSIAAKISIHAPNEGCDT